eukprot:superscaffoldBa00005108_g19902
MVMEEGDQRDRGRGHPATAGAGGRQILTELAEQDLDAICLSTYRTACKLRFIQKRCNLHLIDIYNVIEAVRDAGLNAVELNAGISVTRLENLVSSLFNQLSKRLPTTHTINPRESTVLLVEFILAAIEGEPDSRLTVLSVKAMLATLCGGKLVDKLRFYHPVTCSYCRGNGMTGFRYRCLRCRGYQLCQNCFWRGNVSGSHSNQHQMKEHSSW